MNDKELFEKRSDKEFAFGYYMSESQFLSALSERDKERVCGNCFSGTTTKKMGLISSMCHCPDSPIYLMQQEAINSGAEPIRMGEADGCNQWRAK